MKDKWEFFVESVITMFIIVAIVMIECGKVLLGKLPSDSLKKIEKSTCESQLKA